MDIEVFDEDSIDTEALQAQIDLSMSFAQSLMSSWVETHRLPTSTRKRDLEKELSEYMKRPPRLGVGASIPDGHQNMSREAARLKGQLAGSGKRLREGEGEAPAPARRTSDDDDESRAGAIKKKQKLDPFNIPHGKKEKKREQGKSTLCDVTGLDSLIESASKKQKGSNQEHMARNEDSSPTGPTSCNANALRNVIHAELLKRPLLNLTGPPAKSDDDESDTAEAGAPESPKKKRKRRKKRKPHPIIESPCHLTTTSTAAPSTEN